jgi:hypothetical protein
VTGPAGFEDLVTGAVVGCAASLEWGTMVSAGGASPRAATSSLRPAREWFPGADVGRGDVGSVAKLGCGAGRAVDDDGGFVVLVGSGSSQRKAAQPRGSSPLQHPHSTQYSIPTVLPVLPGRI